MPRSRVRRVLAPDRVEEVAIPVIQRILRQQLQEHGRDQHRHQKPCPPRPRAPPKSGSALPESGEQQLLVRSEMGSGSAWRFVCIGRAMTPNETLGPNGHEIKIRDPRTARFDLSQANDGGSHGVNRRRTKPAGSLRFDRPRAEMPRLHGEHEDDGTDSGGGRENLRHQRFPPAGRDRLAGGDHRLPDAGRLRPPATMSCWSPMATPAVRR